MCTYVAKRLYASMRSMSKSSGNLMRSPGLKAGNPRYGQPPQRKASPRAHEPQDEFTAGFSIMSMVNLALGASPSFSASARPHEQFLQAFLVEPTSQSSVFTGLARSASLNRLDSSTRATEESPLAGAAQGSAGAAFFFNLIAWEAPVA